MLVCATNGSLSGDTLTSALCLSSALAATNIPNDVQPSSFTSATKPSFGCIDSSSSIFPSSVGHPDVLSGAPVSISSLPLPSTVSSSSSSSSLSSSSSSSYSPSSSSPSSSPSQNNLLHSNKSEMTRSTNREAMQINCFQPCEGR
ncbi:unnamed protein product [Protopolystoma xenopodis]|uniref:Uncharacterized protein n=1 Tax=Protopolystoma xenopodis TaxID=117903 RepID=A0A448WP81_9PLAT|nr:unnamed protein product [Protopolystoma xenopodis]